MLTSLRRMEPLRCCQLFGLLRRYPVSFQEDELGKHQIQRCVWGMLALIWQPRRQGLHTAGDHALAMAAEAEASATPVLRQSTAGLMRSRFTRSLFCKRT